MGRWDYFELHWICTIGSERAQAQCILMTKKNPISAFQIPVQVFRVKKFKLMKYKTVIFLRVRVRSDGAAVPRHRNSADSHSPNRATEQPPRVMPRPCSPHKVAVSRGPADSPEKRRLTTFGSAGCINHPDRKAFIDSHSQRSSPSTTRHASLGDHKALEAEALAEVSVELE